MSFRVNTEIDERHIRAEEIDIFGLARVEQLEAALLDVGDLSTLALSVDQLTAGTINTDLFTVDSAIIDTLNATHASIGSLTLNDITTNNLTADTITTQNLNANDYDDNTVSCNTVTAGTLTTASVTSSVYNTGDAEVEAINMTPATPVTPQNTTRVSAETFTNGSVSNMVNYKFVNNSTATFSDLHMAQDDVTIPALIIQGSSISLPQIFMYNNQIGTFDNETAYGGLQTMLSLVNSTTAPYRTLRYQENGKLAIYSDVNTVLWESTNMVSDARAKEDVRRIEDARALLADTHGVLYDFIDESIDDGRRQAGVIAQDVLKVFPECVFQSGENTHYRVELERLVPLLVEGVKDLYSEINEPA